MTKKSDWALDQARARKLLEERFPSQRAAATAMGIAQPTLNRSLNGSPNATIAVIGRIADVLNVPITDLVVRESELETVKKKTFRGPGAPAKSGSTTTAMRAAPRRGGKLRRP